MTNRYQKKGRLASTFRRVSSDHLAFTGVCRRFRLGRSNRCRWDL